MLIAAAVHRIQTQYTEVPVMHCASGDLNPVKWERLVSHLDRFFVQYPITTTMRVNAGIFHQSHYAWLMNWKLYHQYPSQLADFWCGLTGRKKTFVRLFGKVDRMINALHHFTTHGWLFKSKGLLVMWDNLAEEDKEKFNFDIRQVNWNSYLFEWAPDDTS